MSGRIASLQQRPIMIYQRLDLCRIKERRSLAEVSVQDTKGTYPLGHALYRASERDKPYAVHLNYLFKVVVDVDHCLIPQKGDSARSRPVSQPRNSCFR